MNQLTEEEALKLSEKLGQEFRAMAKCSTPNAFRAMLFSAILGSVAGLPDEYWEEIMNLPVSDKMGPGLKKAAEGFLKAINVCRTTQLNRRRSMN